MRLFGSNGGQSAELMDRFGGKIANAVGLMRVKL